MRRRCRQWVMKNTGGRGGGNNNGGGGAPSASPDTNDGGQNNGGGQNNDGGQNNGGGQNNDGGQNNGGGQNNDGGNNNGGGNNAPPAVPPGVGLGILANNCDNSNLTPHDGFQNGNRCVSTAFGEVGAAANNPSLLITQFPNQVRRNQPFTLRVTTKNLVRDRFLAAVAELTASQAQPDPRTWSARFGTLAAPELAPAAHS